MTRSTLTWRAEEACLTAWPAAETQIIDGWRLRRSGGNTKRTNSANPGPDASKERNIIAQAERFYQTHGQTCIFRIPSIADALDSGLAEAGYRREGETLTLLAKGIAAQTGRHRVTLTASPTPEWLAARHRLNTAPQGIQNIYDSMLGLITSPRCFVSIDHESEMAAVAYGVIHQGFLVLESVATDKRLRNQGLGRSAVSALMRWAEEAGASQACLQVVADNAPAISLYRSLGFTQELYRYHYRIGG